MSATNRWDASDIIPQHDTTMIVTGASAGLGRETARVAALRGARVIMGVRNPGKGERVAQEIRSAWKGARVEVAEIDLASLASVRDFAKRMSDELSSLDILVNNAGVMFPPYSLTEDGFELQMGTNHMGHLALTGQLLPLLRETSGSRVVNIASMAHQFGNIDFSDLDWRGREYKAQRAYGDSKLANLYFTYELARRLNGKPGPMVLAAHPGWTSTDLQRNDKLSARMNPVFAQDVRIGTLPQLRAAFDPAARAGQYFGPDGFLHMRGYPVVHDSNKLSHDRSAQAKLWQISTERTGVVFDI